MGLFVKTILLSLLSLYACFPATYALPAPQAHGGEDPLLQVAPKSNTCAGATYPTECTTYNAARKYINQSFQTYKISSLGEAAAIVSLMAFESGDFKYNRPHFGDTPAGKGTRNMQSAAFNQKYAASIPALKDKVAAAGNNAGAVTALLTANGEYDFGSGAWFLTTQCSKAVRDGLRNCSVDGWKAYITECVGTTVTPDRQAYFDRAVQALGAKCS